MTLNIAGVFVGFSLGVDEVDIQRLEHQILEKLNATDEFVFFKCCELDFVTVYISILYTFSFSVVDSAVLGAVFFPLFCLFFPTK